MGGGDVAATKGDKRYLVKQYIYTSFAQVFLSNLCKTLPDPANWQYLRIRITKLQPDSQLTLLSGG